MSTQEAKLSYSSLKEHATGNKKMLKHVNHVYRISFRNFYLNLKSFSKCLRRLTERLWELTFWSFCLHGCDVTRSLSLAPRAVKIKQTPPTEARRNRTKRTGRNRTKRTGRNFTAIFYFLT